MGVVYIVLRVAMGLILFTALVLGALHTFDHGFVDYFTDYKMALWTMIFVLFINSFLMITKRIHSAFGPAVQATTWYTLGVIHALLPLNLHNFAYWQFALVYITMLALAFVLMNIMVVHLSPNYSNKS